MYDVPVLSYLRVLDKVEIVPLGGTTNSSDWMCYLHNDLYLVEICKNHDLLARIYKCDVLPSNRSCIDSSQSDALLFGKLTFSICPVSIHPTVCLINWL